MLKVRAWRVTWVALTFVAAGVVALEQRRWYGVGFLGIAAVAAWVRFSPRTRRRLM